MIMKDGIPSLDANGDNDYDDIELGDIPPDFGEGDGGGNLVMDGLIMEMVLLIHQQKWWLY